MGTKLYHDIPRNRFYANDVEVTEAVYKHLLITGEEFAGNTGWGTEIAKGIKETGTITSTDPNSFTKTMITGNAINSVGNTRAKIIQWAIDRGLDTVDPSKQMVKLVEEVGELAGGLARDNMDVIKDSLGDIYVVMVILALRLGIDLQEAIDSAYDVIKDRKGKLINGVFIKQEDLKE
jgi:NTP pyrophosphatase (non-canonical NTP hydrolase)